MTVNPDDLTVGKTYLVRYQGRRDGRRQPWRATLTAVRYGTAPTNLGHRYLQFTGPRGATDLLHETRITSCQELP